MQVSVILCTYNRSKSLEKALESVAHSTSPMGAAWEVLIVDNNSKDDTRKVAESFVLRYPGRFWYLFEPRQGKSHALNSGIRESRGEILAFMDDDVTVDAEWLARLTGVLHNAEWSGVGGRILPERTFTPPVWLSLDYKYALAPLAFFDLGVEAGELHESPFGTNMAFRREVFETVGPFRTDLGPCPGSAIRGEDTDFGIRVLGAGFRLWYEPSAVVYHSVPSERITTKYFLAWWFDKARADVRQYGIPKDTKLFLAGVPCYAYRRIVLWLVRWVFALSPGRRFFSKVNVWMLAGQIRECSLSQKNKTRSQPGQEAAGISSYNK